MDLLAQNKQTNKQKTQQVIFTSKTVLLKNSSFRFATRDTHYGEPQASLGKTTQERKIFYKGEE